MTDDTIARLRADFSSEQLMEMEDHAGRAAEHLKQAREILGELPGGSDLADLDEIIEECDAAIELLREARR